MSVLAVLLLGTVAWADMPTRGLCAHRGDRAEFPENTVPAFQSAARKGAAMIELDVCRCKTGELVIMHDQTVDRTTTGTGKVEDLTFEALRSFDAGVKKSARFRGVKIPTFDEAIDCLPMSNVWLNVHCRDAVCAEVARKLKAKGRLHQAFVAATPAGVRAARAAVPEIKTCLMTGHWKGAWTASEVAKYINVAVSEKYDFAQPHMCMLTKDDIARFHAAGGKFNYFWLTDPKQLPGMFSLGVDFPLVDQLDVMLAAYRSWEAAGCPAAPFEVPLKYDGDAKSGNSRYQLKER